jgi:hypothetical protein
MTVLIFTFIGDRTDVAYLQTIIYMCITFANRQHRFYTNHHAINRGGSRAIPKGTGVSTIYFLFSKGGGGRSYTLKMRYVIFWQTKNQLKGVPTTDVSLLCIRQWYTYDFLLRSVQEWPCLYILIQLQWWGRCVWFIL